MLIVRCYNITRAPVTGTVACGLPVSAIYQTNLAEERQKSLEFDDAGRVAVDAGSGEIITLEFVPGN